MSEYIVSLSEGKADDALKAYGWDGSYLSGYELTGEVVRCRDCKLWRDGCDWNPFYNDPEIDEPDGYCAWGKRAERGDRWPKT